MIIYPAIDLYDGKAVRLFKGDYAKMTVYSEDPPALARDFVKAGATRIHVVDLEGAKDGTTPNFGTVCAIRRAAEEASASAPFVETGGDIHAEATASAPFVETGGGIHAEASASAPFVEIGGGIRDEETVARYLDAGIDRVILGTAAACDQDFLRRAVDKYAERIAVGIDVRDGYVAVKGWLELSGYRLDEFARMMQDMGVKTIICTDISRDGAMRGANHEMYRQLSQELDIDIVASGGVSSIEDVLQLAALGIHGAIIGKAYYTGAIDLAEAVKAAK